MMKKILLVPLCFSMVFGFRLTAYAQMASAGAVPGQLIRASFPTVYYYGQDGKRYVFPNENTYFTWFSDFSSVNTITDGELAAIPLGGNVTYKPGTRLVKIQSDPHVYWVDLGGHLRLVADENMARADFGTDWSKKIDDIPDSFFVNYKMGDPLSAGPLPSIPSDLTIDQDKGLMTTQNPPRPETVNIDIKDFAFSPASVTIHSGDSVIWTNMDSTEHQIVADSGQFSGPVIAPGGTYTFTAIGAGSLTYHCGIHTSMTGTIIIQ